MDHKIVMASNLLWVGFSLPVAVIFAYVLVQRVRGGNCSATERLMGGVAFVAAASAIHRGYWAFWRYLLDAGETEAAAAMVAHAWIPTVTVAITAVGYALHLKPYLEDLIGQPWAVFLAMYGVMLCALPFLL